MNSIPEKFNAKKWIDENYSWLKSWIEKCVIYDDIIREKSIITTPIYRNVEVAVENHKIELITKILFSRKNVIVINSTRFNSFDGFVETFGRLPTRNDVVHIAVNKFFSLAGNIILSEICPEYNTPENSLISKSAATSSGVFSGSIASKPTTGEADEVNDC